MHLLTNTSYSFEIRAITFHFLGCLSDSPNIEIGFFVEQLKKENYGKD